MFAKAVADLDVAAVLVEKAADLKERPSDLEMMPGDQTPDSARRQSYLG